MKRKKNASYDAVADRKDKAAAFQRRLGNRKIADAIDDEAVEHYALRTGSLIENPRRRSSAAGRRPKAKSQKRIANGLGLGRVIKRTAKTAVKAAILKRAGILNPKRATRCQHPGCDWKMGLKLVETPRGVKALCAEHRQKYPAARTHANPLPPATDKTTPGSAAHIAKIYSAALLDKEIRRVASHVKKTGGSRTHLYQLRHAKKLQKKHGGPTHGRTFNPKRRKKNSLLGRIFKRAAHKAKKSVKRSAGMAARAALIGAGHALIARGKRGPEHRLARMRSRSAGSSSNAVSKKKSGWDALSPAQRADVARRAGYGGQSADVLASSSWKDLPKGWTGRIAAALKNPGDPDLRRQLAKAAEDLKRAHALYSEGKITRYRLAEVRLQHDRIAELARKNPKKSRRQGERRARAVKRGAGARRSGLPRSLAQKISAAKSNHSRGAKLRRRNSAVDDAAGMFEKFAGKPADQVIEMQQREIAHDTFAKLGDLVKIVVGKNRTIEFPDDGTDPVMLCCDPRGKQLYIIGGDQDLSGSLKALGADASKDLCDLGHCSQVEYLARKKFDNFEPVVYYHKLGEESGIKPRLMFDKLNRRLYIVGGEYTIEDRGIVN